MKKVAGILFAVAAIINLILAPFAISLQMSVIHLLNAILYATSAVCMLLAAKGEK